MMRTWFVIILLLASVAAWSQPEPANLDSLRQVVRQNEKTASPQRLITIAKAYLSSAKSHHSREDIVAAYRLLATQYKKLGDDGKALRYFRLYTLEAENLRDIKQRENDYFEKQLYENEIISLATQLDTLKAQNIRLRNLKNEYQRINHHIYVGFLTAGGLGLLLLVLWLPRRRKKKPDSEAPEDEEPSALELLQAENQKLAKQLARYRTEHDLADILGQYVVPNPEQIFKTHKFVRQKFMLYMPQRLIGGDGLFMHTSKQLNLLVVYEAPGEGVTAGLFNARVFSLLKGLAVNNNIMAPNLLLNQLEAALLNEFPAGMPFAEGLRIAACLYNNQQKSLAFAAAGMELYVVRQGILNTVRGRPAAIPASDDQAPFEVFEEQVSKGMHCYLSTDGFWQQTGGKEHKPLGRKAFENAIESLWSQPVKDQEAVLRKILLDWKGSREQDDDILVVGFGF